jgi:DNA-binding NarL/FixJ family response regulator
MAKPIRVLVADDHALLRAGLRALLNMVPDIDVVGEAATGEEAIELVRPLHPDVVVMDLSMPGIGGLEATRQIVTRAPAARVLVLTMHGEEEFLFSVLEVGGSGYLMKQCADAELVQAIRSVAAGELFLRPSGKRLLTEGALKKVAPQETDPLSLLSGREREVLRLTAEGFTAAEIATRLNVGPKTVDTYRQRFMVKLALHHRSELVRFALRHGLLSAAS